MPPVVTLPERLSRFADHWNPRIVGRYNGNEVRLAKIEPVRAHPRHA